MTTSISSPPRERDPLTERILRIANRRRMFQSQLAELADIKPATWYTRCRKGNWTHEELHDIATALGMRVDYLLDVTETL